MKQLLLATHNKAKLFELQLGVKQSNLEHIKILSLDDLRITEDPEETGKTFEENAVLKAKFYALKTGVPTIADDGGLMIEFLNDEPGVKSKRWLGRDATDIELIEYTLNKLDKVPKNKRTAYLKTCLCYYNPTNKLLITKTAKIKGWIAEKQSNRPTEGYPFRALFMIEKYHKYYDELSDKEHETVNHRIKALKQLLQKIKKDLLE